MEFELKDDTLVPYLDSLFAKQNMFRENTHGKTLIYAGKTSQEAFTGINIATLSLKRNKEFLGKCTKWLWLVYQNGVLQTSEDGLKRYKHA